VRGSAWHLIAYAGTDPRTKKERYAYATFRGTEKQADRALGRLVRAVDDGRHKPGSETTVEALMVRWLDNVRSNLSPSTVESFEGWSRRAIVPKLGSVPVAKLDVAELEDFYRTLIAEGVAPLSVRHVHAIIRRALVSAQRWGWIVQNPAALAEPPRSTSVEKKPPTAAEARAFLAWCAENDADLAILLRVAAISGARRGELVGLRLSDVDFDSGLLTIARALTDAGGTITEKEPKSGKLRRLVLDPVTLDVLRAHRAAEAEKAEFFETTFDDDAPLFTTAPGDGWTPGALSKRYARAQEGAGFGPTLHDWRHFSATVALAAGNTPRQVADRLGHSTPVITMTTYAHSLPAADARVADDLASVLDG
jgi:integrase